MSITFVIETSAPNQQLSLPFRQIASGQTINVSWGDGNNDSFAIEGTTAPHTYSLAGTYTVTITGQLIVFGSVFLSNPGYQYIKRITNWDNGYVRGLMFGNASSLTSVPSSLPPTVRDISYLFSGCENFNSSQVSTWDTSNITTMSNLFLNAFIFNQDISLWNTANVQNFSSTFSGARAFNQLIPRNGNRWNTINAVDIGAMFAACSFNNSSITNWNISNVQYMSNLFNSNLQFNQDISSWDTSKVIQMNACFLGGGGISPFNQNLANWNVRSANQMANLFVSCAMSFANYSSTLIGWAAQNGLQPNVRLDADSPFTKSAIVSRSILTSSPYNWAITDGGLLLSLLCTYTLPSNGLQVSLPLASINPGKQIAVNWGDGSSSGFNVSGVTAPHTYSTSGVYTIKISGELTAFGLNATVPGVEYLTSVSAWDNNFITSFGYGFYNASNLTSVPSSLPPTITNINNMFNKATKIDYEDVAYWEVGVVTNMTNFFVGSGFSPINYYNIVNNWILKVSKSILDTTGIPTSLTCFKSDTLILCLIDDIEKYVLIQDIRPNTLVKTYKHGFKMVDIICKSVMQNVGTDERIKDRLYRCPMTNYPELIEDLYITGAHSILVDSITDEQYKNTEEIFGHLYLTDDKVRLMTYLDDRALPYNDCNKFEIWHFALENDDYYGNYGIYANGLLVETASKRWMLEYADMEIIM